MRWPSAQSFLNFQWRRWIKWSLIRLSGLHLNTQMYQILDQPFKISFEILSVLQNSRKWHYIRFNILNIVTHPMMMSQGWHRRREDEMISLNIFFCYFDHSWNAHSQEIQEWEGCGQPFRWISLQSSDLTLPDTDTPWSLSLNAFV